MSLPIRNSCFVPLLKGCSEPGVGYIAASLPSAAHQSARTLPTRLRANVLARKATKVINLSRCGVSFRSREERTMDRKNILVPKFVSYFTHGEQGDGHGGGPPGQLRRWALSSAPQCAWNSR